MSQSGRRTYDEPRPPQPVVGELLDAEPTSSRGGAAQIDKEQWARLLSYWFDSVFEVPGLGWRFGLDPLIGLVPFAGDVATTLVSFYILTLAVQLQVPRVTIARMGLNIAIDYLVGAIPLVGNVFDFAWRANARNMELLERARATPPHLRTRQTLGDWLVIGGVMAILIGMFIGSIAAAILLANWIGGMFRSS